MEKNVSWWFTEISDIEKEMVLSSFDKKCFSLGPFVKELENQFSEKLDVPYVVVTNSGTSALIISLLALGLKPGDEVIVPAITWIATAQAAAMLGLKVKLVDCLPELPIIDPDEIKKKITSKTKAIIPVHLNGRACDMQSLQGIADENGLYIIEDTCKGMFSQNNGKNLGTIGDIGCFSMGMISMISVGYGGFTITNNKDIYGKMVSIRDHGVVRDPEAYKYLGANFKISDILASIGIGQLKRLDEKIEHVKKIYNLYKEGLGDITDIKVIPVNVESNEIPLYTEIYIENRDELIEYLHKHNVSVSKFHLPLQKAAYLQNDESFPNATRFTSNSFIAPSGPSQPLDNVKYCIELIHNWKNNK